MPDQCYLALTELSQRLHSRELSPIEVTQAQLHALRHSTDSCKAMPR